MDDLQNLTELEKVALGVAALSVVAALVRFVWIALVLVGPVDYLQELFWSIIGLNGILFLGLAQLLLGLVVTSGGVFAFYQWMMVDWVNGQTMMALSLICAAGSLVLIPLELVSSGCCWLGYPIWMSLVLTAPGGLLLSVPIGIYGYIRWTQI